MPALMSALVPDKCAGTYAGTSAGSKRSDFFKIIKPSIRLVKKSVVFLRVQFY